MLWFGELCFGFEFSILQVFLLVHLSLPKSLPTDPGFSFLLVYFNREDMHEKKVSEEGNCLLKVCVS